MSRASTTTRPARTVRVTCHAAHPDRRRAGEACGTVLGDIPAGSTFLGLNARRPNTPDDMIRIQCPRRDCRTWNVFRLPE